MSAIDQRAGDENPNHIWFEARRRIFPKAVKGSFRRLKWAIMAVTLAIYYLTPWIRWDRGPHAPGQAALVDLAHRRFYLFAIEIWPHEFYYVAGLLIMAGVGLFLVTSAVGRAWCGYACPQTVWTDLFVHVERFIDGDRNAQFRLAQAPWTPAKIGKRIVKHAVWLVIAAATGGAWIFYFADAPTLARQLLDGTAPAVAYVTIGILTFTTYTLGGLMREQVCIYMCPWPRIQSAMLDERSLVVTYKTWRGEPRSHLKRHELPDHPESAHGSALMELAADATGTARLGDCIDCNACVAACPTGIDIREGPQIGCITCGLCIDACDAVMTRIDRPTRLIGYTTLVDEKLASTGAPVVPPLRRLLRPRFLVYFGFWASIGLAMLFSLGNRSRLDLSVIRDRSPIWVQLSDGAIRNSYTIKVRNMENRPRRVMATLSGLPGGVVWNEQGDRKLAGSSVAFFVDADKVAKVRLFVAAPRHGEEHTDFSFAVRALDDEASHDRQATVFERPEDER